MFNRWTAFLLLGLALLQPAIFPRALAADASAAAADDIFQSPKLLHLRIDIAPEEYRKLRAFRRRNSVRVPATVREGEEVWTNVLIHLKGRGTFLPVFERPSLTLQFAPKGTKQEFHGLTKISLNNAEQDPTCLQEKLARELFTAAGVPAARADNAIVTLNGRVLGLYVLTEGYDKRFLKRHFTRTDGSFFDGGLFEDIDRPLELVSGRKKNDYSGLKKLLEACREPDPVKRLEAISNAVDLDKFLSMIAMETILCHWDGYAMRRTNYRVYDDPASGKLVFLPHGMDRVLGNYRRNLDLPIVPPMVGVAARAIISTEAGRRRFLERTGLLLTNVFAAERLVSRVHEMDRKIAPELMHPAQRWATDPNEIMRVMTSGDHEKDIEDLCSRIRKRAAFLHDFFADTNAIAAASEVPRAISLDLQPIWTLTNWTPRSVYLSPPASFEQVRIGETNYLHVTSPGSYAALGCRVCLSPGEYWLTGNVSMRHPSAARSPPLGDTESFGRPFIMLRHFESPFTDQFHPLQMQTLFFRFDIGNGPVPQEIDLLCEIRGKGEMWIDPESFRLSPPGTVPPVNRVRR